jgi:hypothetical protein
MDDSSNKSGEPSPLMGEGDALLAHVIYIMATRMYQTIGVE